MNLAELAGKNMSGQKCEIGIAKNKQTRNTISLLRISKNDSKRLISSYIECTERLRKAIPANVYSQIIRTDNSSKVVALRKFI